MDWLLLTWTILAVVVSLNLNAAGVTAILHAWRCKMQPGARIVTAAVVAGLLPASLVVIVGMAGAATPWPETALTAMLAFTASFVIAAALSLPGALLVARKLRAPGDEFRTFE